MDLLTNMYRPTVLTDMVGQDHITGNNGILTRMLNQKNIQSCIFYGPPGTGKTTTAKILAEQSGLPFVSYNATNVSLTEIRKALDKNNERTLLYMDEIQYFNKKQQQSLLPYVESGKIILIAATTDNPYYCCYDALLSRCHILEFKPIDKTSIAKNLINIANQENRNITEDAINLIAENSAGDMRRAINQLTMNFTQYDETHTIAYDDVKNIMPTTRMSGFDTDGDDHYSLISGLQKSIRGSDPNAAIFYLARLLEGGDLLSPCRRLLVIAHEDIGLAQPDAAAYIYACVETAKQLGLPEAAKPLTNAVLYLAVSPKCSTCETTYFKAVEDIKNGKGTIIPTHLRHAYSKGYKYPHNYPNHWCSQQYLPDDLAGKIYYEPQQNEFEQKAARYWSNIMCNPQNNNQ